MKELKPSSRLRMFLVVAVLTISTVFFSQNSFSTGSFSLTLQKGEAGASAPLKVKNKTSLFEILTAKRNGEDVVLELKNNYNKAITAYALDLGDYQIRVDTIASDEPILPGSIHTERITLALWRNLVTVAAVVLEDGTDDGDARIIKQIHNYRLGRKAHVEHAFQILEYLLSSPSYAPLSPEVLANRLKEPKTEMKDDVSDRPFEFTAGFKDEGWLMNRKLEELEHIYKEHGPNAFRQRLEAIKELYRKRLSKL